MQWKSTEKWWGGGEHREESRWYCTCRVKRERAVRLEKQDSSMSQSWGKSFREEGAVHLAKSRKEQRQSGAEKIALDLAMGMSPGTFANQRQGGTENCPTENCVRAKASCPCEKEGEMKLWRLEKIVERGKRVVERRDDCGDMMFEQQCLWLWC